MKLLKIIPILLWGLLGARGGYAQTAQEQKFLATTDSLYEQLNEYREQKDYPACERICQQMIDLYEARKAHLSEGFGYFKYGSYYNMACF